MTVKELKEKIKALETEKDQKDDEFLEKNNYNHIAAKKGMKRLLKEYNLEYKEYDASHSLWEVIDEVAQTIVCYYDK